MIIGLGSDIVQIPRIAKMLGRFGKQFEERVFALVEIERAEAIINPEKKIAHYAKRFAAKEAFAKALGTGFRGGLRFKDVAIVNDDNGRPELVLSDTAQAFLESKKGTCQNLITHVTLSDDYPVAMAVVIIST